MTSGPAAEDIDWAHRPAVERGGEVRVQPDGHLHTPDSGSHSHVPPTRKYRGSAVLYYRVVNRSHQIFVGMSIKIRCCANFSCFCVSDGVRFKKLASLCKYALYR